MVDEFKREAPLEVLAGQGSQAEVARTFAVNMICARFSATLLWLATELMLDASFN